ncbi:MAG: hypothetical protein JSS76_15385 [Bacteroidetes bacterium]|nr:hypothetical protein [Bacteroidota bacterium]
MRQGKDKIPTLRYGMTKRVVRKVFFTYYIHFMKILSLFGVMPILIFVSCTNTSNAPVIPPPDIPKINMEEVKAKAQKEASANHTDTFGDVVASIDFKVKIYGEDAQEYEDGYKHMVHIDSPASDLKDLASKDEIVISSESVTLYIDYPLGTPVRFILKSQGGFTRGQLASLICKKYHEIYETESITTTVKVIPLAERQVVQNRNETNGKYQIWGHDLSDLDLSGVEVHRNTRGAVTLEVNVES